MRKIVLILLMSASLFAFEGAAAKALARFFSKETITLVSKQYGPTGIRALERLSATYGKGALEVMKRYGAKYGDEGLKILAQYGEKAVANRASFEMVKRFGDKGFYLVRQFPQRATAYYEKYGEQIPLNVISTYLSRLYYSNVLIRTGSRAKRKYQISQKMML